jgi:anti-sigma regulatory factor (Ser/Thr protein kinase)
MGPIPEHHGLFVYDNDGDFVDRATSYLGAGTGAGEMGLAVVSRAKWALLRESLGDDVQRISHIQPATHYRDPQAALVEYDAVLRQAVAAGTTAVRLLGELPAWETRELCDAWTVYEALINTVFADRPISMVCGYDEREHSAAAMEGALLTHPRVLVDGWEDNDRYQDPAAVVTAVAGALEALPDLRELTVEPDARAFARRLRRELAALGVPRAKSRRLLLAAGEIFDNATKHGHGPQSQRIGRVAGQIVWELSDNGSGFEDPLAGYIPPEHAEARGRGLWTVRRLTQRVEFLTSPRGFTARLWI